jgi:fused signal recognition particle receptor
LANLIGATEIDAAFWRQLEATLIQADMGVTLVQDLIAQLQESVRTEGITHGEGALDRLRELLVDRVTTDASPPTAGSPKVLLLVGVNGSGKTTVAARLANMHLQAGDRPLLAAADTYRAAAGEQLASWGARLGVDTITGQPGSDPGSVVYDAAQAARARDADVLIVDTSGRMHTQRNLMGELQKISRVVAKVIEGAPHQVLLVLDATTGQNGIAQAQAFTEAVGVTGVVLAKLDSSARGGVALAVASQLGLPIRYVGLGERLSDLAAFDPESYVAGLLAREAAIT